MMWWSAVLLPLLASPPASAQTASTDLDAQLLAIVPVISTRTGSLPPASTTLVFTSCTTPEGTQGICGLVSSCPQFVPLAQNLQEPNVVEFFLKRICRTLQNAVHICCPQDDSQQQPSGTLRPESGATRPQSDASRPTPEDRRPQLGNPRPQPGARRPSPGTTRPQSAPGSSPQRPNSRKPVLSTTPKQPQGVPVRGQIPSNPTPAGGGNRQPQPPQLQPQPPQLHPQPPQPPQLPPQLQPQPPKLQPQPPQLQPSQPPRQPSPQRPLLPPSQRPPQPQQPQLPFQRPSPSQRPSLQLPQRPTLPPQPPTLPPPRPTLPRTQIKIPNDTECGQLPFGFQEGDVWPWVVRVGHKGRCGGTLITAAHVLCPAHCLDNPNLTEVVVGGRAILALGLVYPDYNPTTRLNDLALLTLATPLSLSGDVQPACLPFRYNFDGFRYQTLTKVAPPAPGQDRQDRVEVDQVEVVGLYECRPPLPISTFPSSVQVEERRYLCGVSLLSTSPCDAAGSSLMFHDEYNTGLYYVVGVGSLAPSCSPRPSPALPQSSQAALNGHLRSPILLNNPQSSLIISGISKPSQTISEGPQQPSPVPSSPDNSSAALYTRVGAFLDWITQEIAGGKGI